MLFNGLKESLLTEIKLPEQIVSYDLFIDCLHEIYTGEIIIKNPDHAIDLLGPSNYFKLDRLKAFCEDFIKNNIDIENAAYILQGNYDLKIFYLYYTSCIL